MNVASGVTWFTIVPIAVVEKKKRDEIDSSETAMQTTVIAIPLATAIGPCVNKMHLRRGGEKERKKGKKKVVIIHGGLILTTVAFFGPSITMC